MSYLRKLRRIKQRKQAREDAKLWTPDDWKLYLNERGRLLKEGVGKEASARRAWGYVQKQVLREIEP